MKKEQNLKTLYKHREFLDETRIKISTSFDKYMLTLASGSLYLSILFTNSLKSNLSHKNLLCVGWVTLLVSIISMLLSILFSIKAHEQEIDNDDKKIVAVDRNERIICTCNCWSKVVGACEVLGIIFFVIGLSFLSYFYFINI